MATLQIPEPYVAGLIKIGGLEDSALQDLTRSLPELQVSVQYDELTEVLATKVPSVPKNDLREILTALIGLAQARIQLDLPTSEIISLICDAMERSSNEELKRTGKQCVSFSDRLTGLLDLEPLGPLAKASVIVTDHNNVFISAHTLTDIRAVFGKNPEAKPVAAAITHTLAIAHQHNGKRENFYVALDSDDVQALIDILGRALAKAKGLNKLLDDAGVRSLDMPDKVTT